MAKVKEPGSAGRSNRFRMIVIDSDLSDDAIGNLTQAITHALRPGGTLAPPAKALPRATPTPRLNGGSQDEGEEEETLEAEPVEESVDEEAAPRTRSASPKKKFPIPDYLHDLDMTGEGTTFKDYATAQAPAKHAKRYLVAAAWLKNHGGSETINANKVFTCYRTMSWPMNINDWDVNFRNHVHADRMRRKSPGEYIITPIGEEELKKETAV